VQLRHSNQNEENPMKKLLIGGIAAIMATTAFASTASADVVVKYRNGWHRPHHPVVVVRPRARVWVAPRVVYRDCFMKRVKRVNNWGEVVVKRVRVCR
jgi:hypothetical protein